MQIAHIIFSPRHEPLLLEEIKVPALLPNSEPDHPSPEHAGGSEESARSLLEEDHHQPGHSDESCRHGRLRRL